MNQVLVGVAAGLIPVVIYLVCEYYWKKREYKRMLRERFRDD